MENRRDIVIMVDDDITNLTAARNNLTKKYNIVTVPSGEKLLLLLEKTTPALILLDIEMPVMDGYETIKILKANEKTAHIPVIFLTAKIDPESEIKGLSLGAVDYITKPFSRELLIKRIDLHILFEKQKKELLKHNLSLESEIDKKTKTVMELQNAILKTVAELVECRDNVTGGHIERTQHYLRLLVNFLLDRDIYTDELSSWDINLFVMSSQLHDVGKISIKDEILMKPGKLTEEEFDEMKKHTVYGVEIIKRIERNTTENEFLSFAEIMAGNHHEKWNGKGYPKGLKGNEIPLQGRLMTIVDVYDALTDERPYKKAFTHEKSIEIIRSERGEIFDPQIVDVFLEHEKHFEKYISDGKDDDCYENLQHTLKAVANAIGIRGGKERGHIERMRRYLEILVGALKENEGYAGAISAWDTDLFLIAAQLHDVGTIFITDDILNKAGKLSDDEYEKVEAHTDYGVRIIDQIKKNVAEGGREDDTLRHAETMIASHHERWDGSGYPKGLRGASIPLQGRIMAIADVYDALTTDRPHRSRKTHAEAVEIIMNGSGTHFDPNLIGVFLENEKKFPEESVE